MENKELLKIAREKAGRVREYQPDETLLYDLAELFKIFADSGRIRILYALSENELCVSDIASILSMSPSAVSHQLRILKGSRLVRCRREGKSIIYFLADDHVRDIINIGLDHVIE